MVMLEGVMFAGSTSTPSFRMTAYITIMKEMKTTNRPIRERVRSSSSCCSRAATVVTFVLRSLPDSSVARLRRICRSMSGSLFVRPARLSIDKMPILEGATVRAVAARGARSTSVISPSVVPSLSVAR